MEFAGEANEAINGDNSTLPTELTEFVSKISSSLYLALAAGKLLKHWFRSPKFGRSTFCSGVLIFLLAFLGCCGAFRKSACMLNMYAVIMVLLIIGIRLKFYLTYSMDFVYTGI